jgi:predicted O-methyltransferase YrrM
MTQDRWTAVDEYITDLLVRPDEILEAALRDGAAAGLPSINVTPAQGKLLYLVARMMGARAILELGTLAGYSTIWLARALAPGGRVVTLEADPKHADVARANIVRARLADVVDIRVGPALQTLPQIAAEGRGPFDLVFIDADKPSYPEYFEWSLKLSRRGSVIIADNVVRDGALSDAASRDPSVRAVRRLHELATTDARVTATTIQTVGSKGYDGLLIAMVTAS